MHNGIAATGSAGLRQRQVMTVIGLVYFTAYLLFSLAFFRERFMVDGGYMIFEMANVKTYPIAQNRYIIWVLNVLPVSFINLDLPLRTVMLSWIWNYVIFYAAAYFIVLLAFRDRYGAWLILFLNLFVLGSCFFNIADEITPSATMAILLFSMWGRYRGWPPYWLMPLAAIMVFFTVFGHLLVPLSILMVSVYYFLTERDQRGDLANRYLLPAIVFGCLLVMRYTSGLEDNYEREHMGFSLSGVLEVLGTIRLRTLLDFLVFYALNFTVLAIVLGITVGLLLVRRKWMNLLLFLLLAAGYFVLWYITIHTRFNEVVMAVWFNVPIRWLFPLNFLVLFMFLDEVRKETSLRLPPVRAQWLLAVLFVSGTAFQFWYLSRISSYPKMTLEQFDELSAKYSEAGQSKYYMDDIYKCPFGKYHAVYTNSIVFSALDGPEMARQFVYATAGELPLVLETDYDTLYLTDDLDFPMKALNRTYFDMFPGPYVEVHEDFSDCPYKPF